MIEPLAPPTGEFITRSAVPTTESKPANQVAFVMGCCRKSHAMNAARKPFRAGKKAVLVALVYLSAMAIVKSARHRQLPSTISRLITGRVMLGQESKMI